MAQTHLLFRNVCQNRKLFVDELGSSYSVCSFDCIICGQVVIFTGVEDNTAVTDDDSGHVLVNQSSLHVDVSEQDAVDCVVQHNIQSFQCAHCSDFRHAHAGGVVAQSDVSANFFAHFVQCLSHDSEVFLGCISTAETFGCRSVRYIVQQGLCSSTDYSDNICPLSCSGLCLNHVLVDVSGSNDYVDVRFLAFTDGVQVFLSLCLLFVNSCEGSLDGRL